MTEQPQEPSSDLPVLAYGIDYIGVIMLPLDTMEAEVRFFELLGSVRTVGDYVKIVNDPDEPLAGDFPWWEDEDDYPVPADDTPFDIEMVPGAGDGYFPMSIGSTMLSVLESAGLLEEGDSPLDGLYDYNDWMGGIPHIRIPETNRDAMLERLTAAGYTVVERQDLVDKLWT